MYATVLISVLHYDIFFTYLTSDRSVFNLIRGVVTLPFYFPTAEAVYLCTFVTYVISTEWLDKVRFGLRLNSEMRNRILCVFAGRDKNG